MVDDPQKTTFSIAGRKYCNDSPVPRPEERSGPPSAQGRLHDYRVARMTVHVLKCKYSSSAIMNQIKPYPLWLGHAGDGRDFRPALDAGIQALVELSREEAPTEPPRELIYCRFPLLDGVGNDEGLLDLAIGTLASLVRMRIPTLVCSSAGMSRSPAVAAAALALAHHESPEDCLQHVAQEHRSDVSPGLWSEITHLLRRQRPVG
jgi:protein-tyrosine phosphatase